MNTVVLKSNHSFFIIHIGPSPTRFCHVMYYHGDKSYPCLVGIGSNIFYLKNPSNADFSKKNIYKCATQLQIFLKIKVLHTGGTCTVSTSTNEFNGDALSNAVTSFFTFHKQNNNKNVKKDGNQV